MRLPRLRLGLLPRVALALAAVGLLPLGIAFFGLATFNRDALAEQVLRTHIVAARTAAARVGSFLQARISLAEALAASPALAEPRSEASRDLLLRSLQSWTELGVEGIVVVNADRAEVIRVQVKGEEARRQVDGAVRLGVAGPVAVVPGESPSLIRLETPLAASEGFLWMVCSGKRLEDVQLTELGEQAGLLVADRNGGVIVGSGAALTGLPRVLVENAFSQRLEGAGPFPDGHGGEILAAYAPVPESGWVVISRQPAEVAEAVAVRLRRRSALAVSAALALIGLLSAVAWGTVVRPIRFLVREQRDLAGVRGSSGGDEISDLRRTFDALRRSLAERSSLENVFLGRYQVLEVLGTGGMGTVFRGWDPKLQRPVALKTVRLSEEIPSEIRRRMIETLLREAVTVARFNHPNVVSVYDLEDAPEGAFIAMELVDGQSLELLLWERFRLEPDRVAPLGAAIARALAVAHARGVVHRDVKPANVLLGKDGSIKVADFGISDLMAAAGQQKDRVFGTPGYIPPESLLGRGHGPSGDLFALGVILYECLTGGRPFQGLVPEDTVQATLFGVPRPPSRKVSGVAPELESIVLALLEKDPAVRPRDAAEVAAELDRIVAARNLTWSLDATKLAGVRRETRQTTIEAQWVQTMGV